MGSFSPYNAAHLDPKGARDTRPTALQIIQDEGVEGKLASKVITIPGATSGIGVKTARALKATGATLFLTVCNLAKAHKNLVGILEPSCVSLVDMNLDSFKSIRAGAEQILSATKGQVNILISSAGVMGLQNYTLTEDGIEAHFSGNYMGDNYNFEKGEYNHEIAYNSSKLAAVYLANKIERDYGAQGLHATSLHPGAINTDTSRKMPPEFLEGLMTNPYILKILKSAEQGAATTVWAAVGKEWENHGEKYLEDVREAERGEDDGQTFGVEWVKQTYNPDEEDRLWRDSLKIVGLEGDT